MLLNVPIPIDSLCLNIDCMVTQANNKNALIGNDWLKMAGSDLLLSQNVLQNRLGPDLYQELHIDT